VKRLILVASFLCLVTPPIFADEQQLTRDCDQVEQVLLSITGAKYSRDWGVFQDKEGESEYGGCVMVLTGSMSKSTNFQTRFDQLYPSADAEFGKTGWVIDESENGKDDKQNFSITRNGNFCQVSSVWASGDDAKTKGAASANFEIRVECGVKNE